MKTITAFSEMKDCALALGNFDGLHIAHRKIIEKCRDYAREKGLLSGVLLFDRHTKVFFEKEVKLLTTTEEKIQLFEELGIDFVFVKEFDEETRNMKPDEFFLFLKDELKVKAMFVGYDYTFGHKASGDSRLLLKMCNEKGMDIEIIPRIDIGEEPVSSTKIRELIKSGKTVEAQEYLGNMYVVSGMIEKGKQNGTKMGIPTANVSLSQDKLIPPDGVYTGIFEVSKQKYKCLINIGKNPTFDAEKRTLEVHIPEFSGDLYNKPARVLFDAKIREEIKFNSSDELVEQINKDLTYLRGERKI